MDYEVIYSNIPLYFEGLWVTIQLVFLALVIGFVLAVPIALLGTSRYQCCLLYTSDAADE